MENIVVLLHGVKSQFKPAKPCITSNMWGVAWWHLRSTVFTTPRCTRISYTHLYMQQPQQGERRSGREEGRQVRGEREALPPISLRSPMLWWSSQPFHSKSPVKTFLLCSSVQSFPNLHMQESPFCSASVTEHTSSSIHAVQMTGMFLLELHPLSLSACLLVDTGLDSPTLLCSFFSSFYLFRISLCLEVNKRFSKASTLLVSNVTVIIWLYC